MNAQVYTMQLNGANLKEEMPGYVLLGDIAGSGISGMPVAEAFYALKGTHGYPKTIGIGITIWGNTYHNCCIHVNHIRPFIQRVESHYRGKNYPWRCVETKSNK